VLDGTPRFIVSKRAGTSSATAYALFFHTGNRLNVDLNRNVTSSQRYASNTVFQTARWYHLAMVFDGSAESSARLSLYVDGQLDGVFPIAQTEVTRQATAAFSVGTANVGSTQYFRGRIDDLRLYRESLTPAQVARLAAAPAPGSFAAWQARHFSETQLADQTLAASLWGARAQPARDGVANLLKHYFGLAPTEVAPPSVLPELVRVGTGAEERLALRYVRARPLATASGQVEWSTDLIDWHDEGVVTESTPLDADFELVEAGVARAGRPRLFLRLKVESL
jgi:hypothetical protein